MANGQITWASRGAPAEEYIVNPVLESNLSFEYRLRSSLGRLSQPMAQRTFTDGKRVVSVDAMANSCINSKDVGFGNGDEVRFSLVENVVGAPTYGDAPVRDGSYLSYLHDNIRVNKIDTPAFQLQEEMARIKVDKILGKEDGEWRQQITMYFAEEYTFDALRAFLKGMSQGMSVDPLKGGLGQDLGRGVGKHVSCENLIIMGRAEVSSPLTNTLAELNAYEQRIVDDLEASDADILGLTEAQALAKYGAGRSMAQDLRDYISDRKIQGIDMNGQEVWMIPCDPALYAQMTREGGELHEIWLQARERSAKNPIYDWSVEILKLDELCFFKEPYLTRFRPNNYTGNAEVTWGAADNVLDIRRYTNTGSHWAALTIWGKTTLLEAHSGSTEITEDRGRHGKGRTISAHIKQTMKRCRWLSQDNRGTGQRLLNQGSATLLFYAPENRFNVNL